MSSFLHEDIRALSMESSHVTSTDDLLRLNPRSPTPSSPREMDIDIHWPRPDVRSPSNTSRETMSPPSSCNTTLASPHSATNSIGSMLTRSRLLNSSAGSSTSRELIPQFYFPYGTPSDDDEEDAASLDAIRLAFRDTPTPGTVTLKDMTPIAKACGYTHYWGCLLYRFASASAESITCEDFIAAWQRLTNRYHDDSSRFVRLMCLDGSDYLLEEDFIFLLKNIVISHPGLLFMDDYTQDNYMLTVLSRIYYTVSRSWTAKITVQEIRDSNLLSVIDTLGETDDIEENTDYFSHEHHYVLFTKFRELDRDRDLLLKRNDLHRYDENIPYQLIDRIFSGSVTRNLVNGCIGYKDFVWFMLSDVDKTTPRSIEYWFRCLDLDGDGRLTLYEMSQFCEKPVEDELLIDTLSMAIEDALCSLLDMARPSNKSYITLGDLKKSTPTFRFFNVLFNYKKFIEKKDNYPDELDELGIHESIWSRYSDDEFWKIVII